MIKSNRGVTLIALTIVVIIILTITGMLVYSAKDSIYVKNLTNMQNDIANLRDKVSLYYSEYGKIPAQTEYTDVSNLQAAGVIGANDTGKFLIIELEILDGLTLNYGKDYERYKANDYENITDLTDIYIINENSNNIFYVQGVGVQENNTTKMYYTDYTEGDKEEVALKKIVDGVLIPNGFYYVGGTKEEGIVISDDPNDENKGTSWEVAKTLTGNQFVWVPVEDDSAFKTYEGYYDGVIVSMSENYKEPYTNGYTNEVNEYNAMKESVLEHNGFYVGRYEAGTVSEEERTEESGITDDVVVKQGANVYNYIGWSDSNKVINETGGAVEKAKEFASKNNYASVTSTLIYGVQWDAIMAWIEPRYKEGKDKAEELLAEKNFVADSTGKGNYTGDLAVTGSSDDYDIKNIYDLAGNVYEWTMEAYDTGVRTSRVYRGGYYRETGFYYPASYRYYYDLSSSSASIGFRIALYL